MLFQMLTFKLWRDGSFEKLEMLKKGLEVRFKICPKLKRLGSKYLGIYSSVGWVGEFLVFMDFLRYGQKGTRSTVPTVAMI